MTQTLPTTGENGKRVLIVQDKKARALAEQIWLTIEELKEILLKR